MLLKLTGETLIVDELISNKKNDEKDEVNLKKLFDTSDLLSKGKSKISVNLKQLDYKSLKLGDVSGTFMLKEEYLTQFYCLNTYKNIVFHLIWSYAVPAKELSLLLILS